MQGLCAQYNKEAEQLREKLQETQTQLEKEQKNKAAMQENLKRMFLKGVCAMNFEAMNLFSPD